MYTSWQVHETTSPIGSLAELRSRLMRNRTIEADDEPFFFEPVYDQVIHDPHELSGVSVAVERLYAARDAGEHVVIWGDYDADGITSTALMMETFGALGITAVPFLPHRTDHGYGLSQTVLASLIEGVTVVVTVDCGISNVQEVAWLNAQGIDVIVVDHHTIPPVLPPAHAIVHPAHPDASYGCQVLCGAGTSWKLASALIRDPRSGVSPDFEKWLLDLAALGTIADVVPLRGENRAIVQFGLEVVRRSQRPGIRYLAASLRDDSRGFTAEDVAFRIIPQLNAPGRVDHPQPALELLLAKTTAEAEQLGRRIRQLNTLRQKLSKAVVSEAVAQLDPNAPVIFAHHASWPAGVVGLAAARLAEQYGRPAFVLGQVGDMAVGSARSPVNFNVVQMITEAASLLEKFGGHARAAGFSVRLENLSAFRELLNASATHQNTQGDFDVPVLADAVLPAELLSAAIAHEVARFAPFGEGNPEPQFIVRSLELVELRRVGKDGSHSKCTFRVGHEPVEGIGFGLAGDHLDELVGTTVDVVAGVTENEWRGRRRLQLHLRAMAPAGHAVGVASVPQAAAAVSSVV